MADIECIGDGTTQTFVHKTKDRQLTLSIDKFSGKVRICEYRLSTHELIRDTRCDVFDLDSRSSIEDKLIEELCK